MARALTVDEQARYPWASRIVDYVPVGRLRHIAVYLSAAGLTLLLITFAVVAATDQNVRNGVHVTASMPGRLGLWVALGLMAAGFVLGVYTAVQAVVRSAKGALVWSVFALWELPLILLIAFRDKL
jgi:hypothetical protein